MTPLKTLAIQRALENNWQDACQINQQILEEKPNDIDTLNRLAFAFIKLTKYKKAKDIYKSVIAIDKTNPIALKNIKKLEGILSQKSSLKDVKIWGSSPRVDTFIEEAGKTKTLDLKNIADKKTLSFLQPGDEVVIAVKRLKIFILTSDKKYIGMLPDNLGSRLVKFINGGNKYSAYVKAIGEKSVTVFVKEEKKVTKYSNQPSFISSSSNPSHS